MKKSKETIETPKLNPIELKGTIEYTININEDSYRIDIGKRNIEGDLATILVTSHIVEQLRSDMVAAKKMNMPNMNKTAVNTRLTKLTHASGTLQMVSNDIVMTIVNNELIKNGNTNSK